MRRVGFTLIELLTIIAIMGVMVAVGVASWRSGKSRSQLAGATRDIMAVIRQARSIALITQKPAIITYATEKDEDDEPYAKITIEAAKLFDDQEDTRPVYTLDGDRVGEDAESPANKLLSSAKKSGTEGGQTLAEGEGETLNDVLLPKISRDIVKGIRIKVLKEDEQLLVTSSSRPNYKSAISVFSTVGGAKLALGRVTKTEASDTSSADTAAKAAEATESPVEIVWSTNGRADGHTIWVYPDGSTPEKGLSIVVDKFGGCKVTQWEEEN